jgi:chaperonin GroES
MQFEAGGEWQSVLKQDYQTGSGVQPYSDPSMVSDMQRMARTQFLLGFLETPFVQPLKILERAFDAADIENPAELLVSRSRRIQRLLPRAWSWRSRAMRRNRPVS